MTIWRFTAEMDSSYCKYLTKINSIFKWTIHKLERFYDNDHIVPRSFLPVLLKYTVVDMTTGGTPTSTTTPIKNASAVMRIGSSLQSICTPALPSINVARAILADSAFFCKVCLDRVDRLTQCPFIPICLRQCSDAQRENSLKSLPPKL